MDFKMEIQKNDVVKGWFGTAVVTDVAFGQLITLGGLIDGPEDDMVRVEFGNGRSTYIYRSDVKEIL